MEDSDGKGGKGGEGALERRDDLDPQRQQQRLDFASPAFDAAAALADDALQPPVPDAPVLEHFGQARALLPPEAAALVETGSQNVAAAAGAGPSSVGGHGSGDDAEAAAAAAAAAKAARVAKAAALKERAARTIARAEAGVAVAPLRAVIAAAAAFGGGAGGRGGGSNASASTSAASSGGGGGGGGGPLAALAGWALARARVTVVTRHAAGVRGRAAGTLLACDRYMNLLLAEVEEAYTVMTKVARVKCASGGGDGDGGGTGGGEGGARRGRVRWCRKQDARVRRLELVLLRGDQVVSVARAEGDGGGGGTGSGSGGGRGGGGGGGCVGGG